MLDYIASNYNYWTVVILMMIGLYIVFAASNLVKRLVGLGVFQTSVGLFYISIGKVDGGIPTILPETSHAPADAEHSAHAGGLEAAAAAAPPADAPLGTNYGPEALDIVYSNPLPHVLILTAIVVSVATLAVGLALVVRIREAYRSIEDDDITAMDYSDEVAGADA